MEQESFLHKSIMLDEVISILNPSENEIYVDCTLGAGGHTRQILKTSKCNVIGIDRDPSTFLLNKEEYISYGKRLSLVEGKFGDLENHITTLGIEKVDAIFFDLGVSSMQLDNADRGFSFRFDAPLDMRMGNDGQTAFEIVNKYKEADLANIIFRYGEERQSRKIAHRIVEHRKQKKIETTFELSEIIKSATNKKYSKIHPSTKTFQGLRIFLNDELKELYKALVASENLLNENGRLIVIAFHSLEDRIVKNFLRFNSISEKRYKLGESSHSFFYKNKRVSKPSDDEIKDNPRARSARLRYAYKTATNNHTKSDHSYYKYGGIDV